MNPLYQLSIPPLGHIEGCVRLPGSKSISNRVLLLAALASGDTEIPKEQRRYSESPRWQGGASSYSCNGGIANAKQ
jgi:hypothetical protein